MKGAKEKKWYTPVVTGSMRNRVRPQGIEAPRGAYDGGSEAWRGSAEVPPPRVFCEKRLDLLDSKGVDFFGAAQEAARD